jgi:hypothetical protein
MSTPVIETALRLGNARQPAPAEPRTLWQAVNRWLRETVEVNRTLVQAAEGLGVPVPPGDPERIETSLADAMAHGLAEAARSADIARAIVAAIGSRGEA